MPPPATPDPRPPLWRVEWRHAEGGAWSLSAETGDEALARDEALCPQGLVRVGDLWRLLDPRGEARAFGVLAPSGVFSAPGVPRGDPLMPGPAAHDFAWEAAWEGQRVKPESLLDIALPWSDHYRLVRAAAACADLAAAAHSELPPEALTALAAARAWWRGEVTAEEAHRCGEAAWAFARDTLAVAGPDRGVFGLVEAVRSIACVASAALHPPDAVNAAFYAASGVRGAVEPPPGSRARLLAAAATRRELAARVRAWLPLSTVLLGAAGAPAPLGPEGGGDRRVDAAAAGGLPPRP